MKALVLAASIGLAATAIGSAGSYFWGRHDGASLTTAEWEVRLAKAVQAEHERGQNALEIERKRSDVRAQMNASYQETIDGYEEWIAAHAGSCRAATDDDVKWLQSVQPNFN